MLAEQSTKAGVNQKLILLARIGEGFVGLVLLVAGILKAYDPLDFAQQIAGYKIITAPVLVSILAWVMIVIECALGMALIVGLKRRVMAPAGLALIILFLAALGWAWYSGATTDCGCFGSWVKRTPQEAFIEDIILLVLMVAPIIVRHQPPTYAKLRLGVVMAMVVVALSITTLASFSPKQSNDPVVRLQAKGENPFEKLQIADLSVDLKQGDHLVALIDTGCDHCQASVPTLNEMATGNQPPLCVICPNTVNDIKKFQEKLNAQFPIGRISDEDFLRLLDKGDTPRFFLIRGGNITKIWDGKVPSITELSSAGGA